MRRNDDVDAPESLRAACMPGRRTVATLAGTCERFAAVRLAQGLLVLPVPMVRMARRFGHWYGDEMPAGDR